MVAVRGDDRRLPTNAQARKDQGEVFHDIGALHAKHGRMDTAMEYQRKSIAIREALAFEAAPGDLQFH